MNRQEAAAVAELLNQRNQLSERYTAGRVLEHQDEYIVGRTADGEISGCVRVKPVQWYQAELLHLTVSAKYPRQGIGRGLVNQAIERARAVRARVLQCTIRIGNVESEGLFASIGFKRAAAFHNAISHNNVAIWQLALEPSRE